MRRSTVWLVAGSILFAWACGGEGGAPGTSGAATADTETEDTDVPESIETADQERPDNCSLITPDEATALAGYELVLGGDSFLGCGYHPPGSDVADIVVNAVLLDGDVASIAADGFPDATDIIPVDVGEDTVAVNTPSGTSSPPSSPPAASASSNRRSCSS